MKQTVEEAAYDYATNKTKFRKDVLKEVDAETYVSRHADSMEDFQCGAEWQSKQSPWISVKERLPEVGEHVLTKGAYGFLICYFSSLGEWETGANVNKERLGITHWLPIPSFDDILEANKDVLEHFKTKEE